MAKVRKQFILDENKIKKVKTILGVRTDTEAVDRSMDLILNNSQINQLHKKLTGKIKIRDMDQSLLDE